MLMHCIDSDGSIVGFQFCYDNNTILQYFLLLFYHYYWFYFYVILATVQRY